MMEYFIYLLAIAIIFGIGYNFGEQKGREKERNK